MVNEACHLLRGANLVDASSQMTTKNPQEPKALQSPARGNGIFYHSNGGGVPGTCGAESKSEPMLFTVAHALLKTGIYTAPFVSLCWPVEANIYVPLKGREEYF